LNILIAAFLVIGAVLESIIAYEYALYFEKTAITQKGEENVL